MNDKVFNIDNPFFEFMSKCADYVILNLLFLLTSVPVITFGASLRAMHTVLRLMSEGREGNIRRTYFSEFIKAFKPSLKLWLFMLGTGALLLFDLMFMTADSMSGQLQMFVLPVVGGLILIWFMIFSWSFVSQSEEDTLKNELKRSLYLSVRHFPVTVLLILIEMIPIFFFQASFRIFAAVVLPIYVLLGFSFTAMICGKLTGKRIEES